MKDFTPYRDQIVGIDQTFDSPDGKKRLIYADWTASGRLYKPIEATIASRLGPFVANPHTQTTESGTRMTESYHEARHVIKNHVHADDNDVIFFAGFGMTAVINKLQRLLGLRVPEKFCPKPNCRKKSKPLVIITHMEHHSNQTSWNECCCDVEIIRRADDGLPDLEHLREILAANQRRELLIGSFSACSNVTGIHTPIHELAAIMHRHNGYCFVDFAASAPYVKIDMHPDDPQQRLDAIFFSPHKFLGGPGSSGVMVLNKQLYHNRVPDHPGGGTVLWTNPWGEQHYYEDIEVREDGGTPGYLQAIRAALAVLLKEHMGSEHILAREEALKNIFLKKLCAHPQIEVLEAGQPHKGTAVAGQPHKGTAVAGQPHRLGIISFYSLHRHHNLIVQLLNDRFGIQSRGGCSCAGTYGHILLHVEREWSRHITNMINHGDLSEKPGWVRISLHPTLTETEVITIAEAVHAVLDNYEHWQRDYVFEPKTGEFRHRTWKRPVTDLRRDFRPY